MTPQALAEQAWTRCMIGFHADDRVTAIRLIQNDIEAALRKAADEEREACAQLAFEIAKKSWDAWPATSIGCCNCGDSASEASQAIRDRSKKEAPHG